MKKPHICLVILILTSFGVYGQDKKSVIDRYFKSIGGRDRWNSIQTKFDSSLYITYRPGLAPDTAWLVTVFMRPNLQRVWRLAKGNPPTILGYDGHVFWTQTGKKQTVRPVEESLYFVSTIMLGQADLLVDDSMVIYRGIQDLDDSEYEVLEVKRNEWLNSYLYFFNRKSGLLHCMVAHKVKSKRRTYLKDYRLVNGILWPFVEETSVAGEKEEAHRLELRLNLPIGIEVFRP